MTNADALLHAAKDMHTALLGGIGQATETKAAINKLMEIFKQNAEKEKLAKELMLKGCRRKRRRKKKRRSTM
jgi:hypothetical protein